MSRTIGCSLLALLGIAVFVHTIILARQAFFGREALGMTKAVMISCEVITACGLLVLFVASSLLRD